MNIDGAQLSPLRRIDSHWHDLPLRTRLTTGASIAATAVIIAVIAVAYVTVRHELRTNIDSQLRHQANEVQVDTQFNPLSGARSYRVNTGVGDIQSLLQVIDSNGTRARGGDVLPVTASDVRVARSGGSSVHDGYYNGRHVRILTTPLPGFDGYAVQIALPLRDVDRQLHVLRASFALLALAGLGLTVLVSWAAVRRTMRPVQTLTETAEQVAATRDLTVRIPEQGNDELGRLAATFNTMLDALERSLGAQRQLVMDASHELRTPLASLRTNVEVLNDIDRLPDSERRAVLTGIVTQLDELTGLVTDVVELARGEAPAAEHDDIAFDELVSHAVARARRHWPAVTFRLVTVPVTVRGVSRRLDRAVANMLDNAGKFTPPGTEVEVALAADGTLTVADRGPGVPTEALPHVFDRFFRADEARALPGSGLGLAIVQQVVEGHGGTIELTNRPDGGAVATLRLPALPAPAPAVTVPPAPFEVPHPSETSLFH
ncbi:MAG TPA: HAMP domain-containing sensor histidine kinase [Mycobacteriales bacterium]|nr:HAMP domain-containing sensor histidine kinase [Mycobacteriales bacterium]